MDDRVQTTIIFITRSQDVADSEAYRNGDYQLRPDDIDEDAIKRAKVVHASTFALSREPCRSAVEKAFQIAQEHNKIISLDPNYNPAIWPQYQEARKVLRRLFAYATISKPSLEDAERIFGCGKTPRNTYSFSMDGTGIHRLYHGCRWHHSVARRQDGVHPNSASQGP